MDKLKRIMSGFIPYATMIQVFSMILMIFVAHLEFLTRKSMFLPAFVLGVFATFFLIFTKDLHEANMSAVEATKRKKRLCRMYAFTLAYWMWELIDRLTLMMGLPAVGKVLSFGTLVMFLIVALVVSASQNETVEGFVEWNPYLGTSIAEMEPGDVVIGTALDKDTKKPTRQKVITYYKDRFVHTLVLGPTGSGKTSQILGPMSYQDLQNKEIGVIILDPKGDFAEQAYARAKHLGRKAVQYFNPVLPDNKCPYFNPLMCTPEGEAEMVENVVTAFQALDSTSSSYFRDQNEILLRYSIKAVKRIYGNDATFNDVIALMTNLQGKGKIMMTKLHQLGASDSLSGKEYAQIENYFNKDYFPGLEGQRGATKTYTDSSAVRNQLQKLVANPYLNRVLNPPKTSELKPGEYLDFDRVLANGEVLCMCSAQGALRGMSQYLGYFLILTLQSSIFRRPGTEVTRRGCALYIDEFQTYANDSMENLLTQGRSYRVACIFATQNRALINSGGDKGRRFLDNVTTNMRNIILFPGMSADDAKFYSQTFGSEKQVKLSKSTTTRAYVPKFMGFDSARESISEREEDVPYFSESELVYQKFGNVVVRLIDHNTLQRPVLTEVHFVDRSVDKDAAKYLAVFGEDDWKTREEKAKKVSEQAEREVDQKIRLDELARHTAEFQKKNSFDLGLSRNDDATPAPASASASNAVGAPDLIAVADSKAHDKEIATDETVVRDDIALEDDEEEIIESKL